MSGLTKLFGDSQAAAAPYYTGLQIQTAVNTLPIPIVWGEGKIAPNVIWYNNFQIDSGGGKDAGGKGGLFNPGAAETSYSAAVMMALCEGPIAGLGQIWKNQSVYGLAELGLNSYAGSTPQAVWAYLAAAYPDQALTYDGTAYVSSANYSLGSSATLDNHNFEVQGFFFGSGFNGTDADPAQIVSDFLINPQYGVGFPAASIDATSLFGSGGDASYQTYCLAIGLALSPALTDQEQAANVLGRWLQLTNTAAVWSGGLLRFVPYGDVAITAGAVVAATQTRQIGQIPSGATNPPDIVVASSSYYVSDDGVTYGDGTPLTYVGATTAPTASGTYGRTPAGTYWFASGDEGVDVIISFSYQIARSYKPNIAPVYDLSDDDFKLDVNEDPLQVTRSDPYDAYNVWRLEISDRDNGYNMTVVESRDQNAIELFGTRIAPTVTAHEIRDPNIGLVSGQLQLQRAIYIRNTYKFRLSWEYCLLDPMDIVTVTDTVLGLSSAPIRITEIEEDENGLLQVTAEEFPPGVATATLYATQRATNNPLNRAVAADPVNAPIIFEPPPALVGGIAQVWIAASGGVGGTSDPNWGGANVWLSSDGTSYGLIGAIAAPARQGALTATLSSFSSPNPDTADTLAVNMAESRGVLATATSLDAQLANTLCIVGSELISYATATLTSANNYALTYLYRGLYGTAVSSHAAGAPFARLDGAIFKYDLPPQYVGKTLYIKLQSFNVFGAGVQDLSTCAAYTYMPTGVAIDHPVAESITISGGAWDFGPVTGTVVATDDFGGSLALPVVLGLDFGSV